MRLILGLGNPGRKYAKTRHNIGFRALDLLASRHRITLDDEKELFIAGRGRICGEEVVLAKPLTYMNESGRAVTRLLRGKKDFPAENVIVFQDEVDLPLGRLKLKSGGGEAGHRGLLSVSDAIGQGYIRLRLGVGRSVTQETADHVLEDFTAIEEKVVDEILLLACEVLEDYLAAGLAHAQNHLARKSKSSD
jgi:PTH1 family peptidyl-tRNA hydrolase